MKVTLFVALLVASALCLSPIKPVDSDYNSWDDLFNDVSCDDVTPPTVRPTSTIVCAVPLCKCEKGQKVKTGRDKNGCETCECVGDRCFDVACKCEAGSKLITWKGDDGCEKCRCEKEPVCADMQCLCSPGTRLVNFKGADGCNDCRCDPECPVMDCRCQKGQKMVQFEGSDGCQKCKCEGEACPPVPMCQQCPAGQHLEPGYTDDNGCEILKCNCIPDSTTSPPTLPVCPKGVETVSGKCKNGNDFSTEIEFDGRHVTSGGNTKFYYRVRSTAQADISHTGFCSPSGVQATWCDEKKSATAGKDGSIPGSPVMIKRNWGQTADEGWVRYCLELPGDVPLGTTTFWAKGCTASGSVTVAGPLLGKCGTECNWDDRTPRK